MGSGACSHAVVRCRRRVEEVEDAHVRVAADAHLFNHHTLIKGGKSGPYSNE